jgi:galactokinase
VRVVEEHRKSVGRDPDAVGSAPGRVNLIGEHLDYNGGRVLPIALTVRTDVAVSARGDGRLVARSLQESDPVELDVSDLSPGSGGGWASYVAGVLWALDATAGGWDVVVDGRVPSGAGLSSSAALECAVAVAVLDALGREQPRDEVIRACVRAENDYVGAATGSMDQTASMLCEPDHALLVDFAADRRRPIPWRPPGDLLVIDTRAFHEHASGEYGARRRDCEAAAEQLGRRWLVEATAEEVDGLEDERVRRRARHVVTEQARVMQVVDAVQAGAWQTVGRIFTESHASMRDDFEISCPELDTAVESALEAGAWGARMTGGGFGGSAVALVPPGRTDAVEKAVRAAFGREGFDAPSFVDGTAGGPAGVLSPRGG